MKSETVVRWGGLVLVATAALYGSGGILAAIMPNGGLAGPLVPLLYYLGTVAAVPAVAALYAALGQETGRQRGGLALAGLVLAMVGATLYSGPQLALLAGMAGAAGWHDVWFFAMGNVLLIGPAAFFSGLILLGLAVRRSGRLPGWAGALLAIGAAVWLVVYVVSVVPGGLTVASLVTGAGLAWLGWAMWSSRVAVAAQPSPVAG